MDSASDQLLAGSAFTADQNCRIRRRDPGYKLIHRPHLRTLADHTVFDVDVGLQPAVFVLQPFHLPGVLERHAGCSCDAHHQLKVVFVESNSRLFGLQVDHTGNFVE